MSSGTEAGTGLDPVFQHALQLVRTSPAPSIEALAEVLAGSTGVLQPAEQPFPAAAAPSPLPPEALAALKALPKLFGKVTPGSRRSLNAGEHADLMTERIAIGVIVAALEARKKAITNIVRTDMDVTAEETGTAVPKARLAMDGETVIVEATKRTSDGHYLLAGPKDPNLVPVHTLGKAWSLEYTSGKLIMDNGRALAEAEAAGTISREDYLAATREIRVVDQPKLMQLIADRPEAGLKVLRLIATREDPGASLYVRKLKE